MINDVCLFSPKSYFAFYSRAKKLNLSNNWQKKSTTDMAYLQYHFKRVAHYWHISFHILICISVIDLTSLKFFNIINKIFERKFAWNGLNNVCRQKRVTCRQNGCFLDQMCRWRDNKDHFVQCRDQIEMLTKRKNPLETTRNTHR